MFCETCGHKIEGEKKFCPKCGVPIYTPEQAAADLAAKQQQYQNFEQEYVSPYAQTQAFDNPTQYNNQNYYDDVSVQSELDPVSGHETKEKVSVAGVLVAAAISVVVIAACAMIILSVLTEGEQIPFIYDLLFG